MLVDDQELMREGLACLLGRVPGFVVVGQCSTAADALGRVNALEPDVVLLDDSLPGSEASVTIPELHRRSAGVRVLVLTGHDNPHYAARSLESGAHGYVSKRATVAELLDGLRSVARGEVYVSSRIAASIMTSLRGPMRPRLGLETLSPREREALRLLATGLSLKEAAAALGVSLSTVSTHRSRLMVKLQLQTTADLVRFAIEHRLLEPW